MLAQDCFYPDPDPEPKNPSLPKLSDVNVVKVVNVGETRGSPEDKNSYRSRWMCSFYTVQDSGPTRGVESHPGGSPFWSGPSHAVAQEVFRGL